MKKFIFILLMGLSIVLATQQVRNASFKVEVYGKGAPLLLIPGLACSGEVWEATVDSLKDRYECHVLTLSEPAPDHPV
jgi:N-formylmaleamate deformylase